MFKTLPGIKYQGFVCLFLILFCQSGNLFSQNFTGSQKPGEQIFTARVKQFGEFVDRFNLTVDFKGEPIDSSFRAKMSRSKMIFLLFDLKDKRVINENPGYKEDFAQLKGKFVVDVDLKKYLINKTSPGIIAEARAKATFNGKPCIIRLFLNQETSPGGAVKWVLLSAKSEIFNFLPKDTTMVRFIPPASNETDFINLKRALEDTGHLQEYAASVYKPDYLAVFFYLIRSGQLRYEYIEETVYHIIDIPGWYIKVREFDRNELNSGWLITDLKVNKLGVNEFLETL